jgi:hypothetical protein
VPCNGPRDQGELNGVEFKVISSSTRVRLRGRSVANQTSGLIATSLGRHAVKTRHAYRFCTLEPDRYTPTQACRRVIGVREREISQLQFNQFPLPSRLTVVNPPSRYKRCDGCKPKQIANWKPWQFHARIIADQRGSQHSVAQCNRNF